MDSIKTVLKKFNPVTDKYVSREFQTFALYLAEELNDYKHRAIYMKLAKTVHRSLLEKALSYVSDSKVDNRGALFMWKLKQLRDEAKKAENKLKKSVELSAQSKKKNAMP